jgi:prepilin peptidase CpaA
MTVPFGEWIQLTAAAATAILLIAAGVNDVRRYRIPNTIVYAIVIAFAVGAAFSFSWPAVGWSALAGVGMFLLGAGLFAFGLFGGGDVKLVAAMALWTGFADLPRFLLVMTAAGGLLGVVWAIRRRRDHQAAAAVSGAAAGEATGAAQAASAPGQAAAGEASADDALMARMPSRMPYGVAIAIAGLDFFITSAHSPFAPIWPWLQ